MMANDPSTSRLLPRPVKSPAATREDLRKRAATRLAERIDLAKSKFKPLSLLRQDARRVLDQLLDQDAPTMGREDRDKFVDEILSQSQGFGPLEELFRDESVTEFMTMAFNQIINRKGESWLPTSVQFRDADQYRQILVGFAEFDPLRTSSVPSGYDATLPNGFRVVGILPPAILEQPPLAVFTRGSVPTVVAKSASGAFPMPNAKSGTISAPSSGSFTALPAPPLTASGTINFNTTVRSGADSSSNSLSARMPDPFGRLKQRVIERLVSRLAAAGVNDLSQLPKQDLQKVIGMYVQEFSSVENLSLDESTQGRLTLEILTAMNR